MPRPSKYNYEKVNEFIERHMDIINAKKKGYIKYLLQLMEEEEGIKITNVINLKGIFGKYSLNKNVYKLRN